MPYIAINTSQDLDSAKKEKIKTTLGSMMSIIPTKNEAGLMIDFSGNRTIYKAGVKVDGAFVEVRLFGKSELEPKKKYTADVIAYLCGELGIKKENVYFNISEFDCWGSNGQLNTR